MAWQWTFDRKHNSKIYLNPATHKWVPEYAVPQTERSEDLADRYGQELGEREGRGAGYRQRMENAHTRNSPDPESRMVKAGNVVDGAVRAGLRSGWEGAKEGARNALKNTSVEDIRARADTRAQAAAQKAHADAQATIAESSAAEQGVWKQRAAQKATRDERTEAAKDAAQSAASQARAQMGNGVARAMGGGAASMQAAQTAAQAVDTTKTLSENRQRVDAQAQQAAQLANTQAKQRVAAEQARAGAGENTFALQEREKHDREARRLAMAVGAANTGPAAQNQITGSYASTLRSLATQQGQDTMSLYDTVSALLGPLNYAEKEEKYKEMYEQWMAGTPLPQIFQAALPQQSQGTTAVAETEGVTQ